MPPLTLPKAAADLTPRPLPMLPLPLPLPLAKAAEKTG